MGCSDVCAKILLSSYSDQDMKSWWKRKGIERSVRRSSSPPSLRSTRSKISMDLLRHDPAWLLFDCTVTIFMLFLSPELLKWLNAVKWKWSRSLEHTQRNCVCRNPKQPACTCNQWKDTTFVEQWPVTSHRINYARVVHESSSLCSEL